MNDIAERLRRPMVAGLTHPIDAERAEAAAEIERLTAECFDVANALAKALAERDRLRADKAELLATLSFYARKASYFQSGCGEFLEPAPVMDDGGETARAAITKAESK